VSVGKELLKDTTGHNFIGGTIMCGIVGYVGDKQATEFLLEGLSKLEYRGYDSAGIAVYNDGKIRVEKSVGRLAALA
jgi:glucosamine--fructose-6-phosphate aminotransferase (isomerizing)